MAVINLSHPEQDVLCRLRELSRISDSIPLLHHERYKPFSREHIVRINAIWESFRESLELKANTPLLKLKECFWGVTAQASQGVRSSDLETRRSSFVLLRDLVKRGYAKREAAAVVQRSIGHQDDDVRLEGILLGKVLTEKGDDLPIVVAAAESGLRDKLLPIRQDAFWLFGCLIADKKVNGFPGISDKVSRVIELFVGQAPELAFRLFEEELQAVQEGRPPLSTDSAKHFPYLISYSSPLKTLLKGFGIDLSADGTQAQLACLADPMLSRRAEKSLNWKSREVTKQIEERLTEWVKGTQVDLQQKAWSLLYSLVSAGHGFSLAKEVIQKRLEQEDVEIHIETLSFIHKMEKDWRQLVCNIVDLAQKCGQSKNLKLRQLGVRLLCEHPLQASNLASPIETVLGWLEDESVRLDAITLVPVLIELSNVPQIMQAVRHSLNRAPVEALRLLTYLVEKEFCVEEAIEIIRDLKDPDLDVVKAVARLLEILVDKHKSCFDEAEECLSYYVRNRNLCWFQEGSINVFKLALTVIQNDLDATNAIQILQWGVQDEVSKVCVVAEQIVLALNGWPHIVAQIAHHCRLSIRINLVKKFLQEGSCLHAVWQFFSEYSASKYLDVSKEDRIAVIDLVTLFVKSAPTSIDLVEPLIAMLMTDRAEDVREGLQTCAQVILLKGYYNNALAVKILREGLEDKSERVSWRSERVAAEIILAGGVDVGVELMRGSKDIEVKIKLLGQLVRQKRCFPEARAIISEYMSNSGKSSVDPSLVLNLCGELIKVDPTSIDLVVPLMCSFKTKIDTPLRMRRLGLAESVIISGCETTVAIEIIGNGLEDEMEIVRAKAIEVVSHLAYQKLTIATALLKGCKKPDVAERLRKTIELVRAVLQSAS